MTYLTSDLHGHFDHLQHLLTQVGFFHNPEYAGHMLKANSWWDIDTEATSKDGKPMLLCLETLVEHYIID